MQLVAADIDERPGRWSIWFPILRGAPLKRDQNRENDATVNAV